MKEYKNESIALVMSFCLSQEHLSTIDDVIRYLLSTGDRL
jgi:hypothetical protein